MIGETAIDLHLRKTKLLIDSVAWFDSHDTELKRTLINLIQIKQLKEKGVDMFNEVIGYYSEVTEMINPQKQAGTPYTLEDTGAFYRSMFIIVLKDSIVVDADYTKMEDQDWWSENILGLTEENLLLYAEMVKKNYIRYARRILELD